MKKQNVHSIFIEGELINLCVPTIEDIDDGWTQWMNDPVATEYLKFGIFPQHREDQIEFYQSLRSKDRFAVMIRDKASDELLGTISLSVVDMVGRSAQISLILGKAVSPKKLVSLEAMSRVTRHAFEIMGLDRVWAGQPFPAHRGFNHALELLGFRTEGYLRHASAKGRFITGGVIISCLYEDYAELLEVRGGEFWPGNDHMLQLIRKLPKKSLASIISENIVENQAEYFRKLKEIEKRIQLKDKNAPNAEFSRDMKPNK